MIGCGQSGRGQGGRGQSGRGQSGRGQSGRGQRERCQRGRGQTLGPPPLRRVAEGVNLTLPGNNPHDAPN